MFFILLDEGKKPSFFDPQDFLNIVSLDFMLSIALQKLLDLI
jgi:hypothetical protein